MRIPIESGKSIMLKLLSGVSRKAGQAPGSLVYTGEKKVEKPRITVFRYDEENFSEKQVENAEECKGLQDQEGVCWINVDGLHDISLLEALGEHFDLHPLVLEDILNTSQRPKAENFGEYIYTVLTMLYLQPETGGLTSEQVSLVLGKGYVLSFQERIGDVFEPVRERIRGGKGRVRTMGADYLAYALLDAVIDNYYAVLDPLIEKIENIEKDLIARPQPENLRQLYTMKQEILFFRKVVRPLRDMIGTVERDDSTLIGEKVRPFMRDLYDHIIHVGDSVETIREALSEMLNLYLSSVSNRMNAVMKVLTIIATIFIPLTFIAGIYGMNFEHMPELGWRWSYPIVCLVMLLIAGVMLVLFKRKNWL